ncbi:hypothetical protein [Candidatus Clavichlamydia salmonicola]|uniref:hypothetical protein n=1 Tax=Candidatus Clavichlamydia salmonicola TaxID=469812 RepID=UPI001891C9C0|nr:hypothetical protein [Candidatus Clavichlamydia salmonicola]
METHFKKLLKIASNTRIKSADICFFLLNALKRTSNSIHGFSVESPQSQLISLKSSITKTSVNYYDSY